MLPFAVSVDPIWQPTFKPSCISNCSKDIPNVLQQNLYPHHIGHLQRILRNFSVVVVMRRMNLYGTVRPLCNQASMLSLLYKKNIHFTFPQCHIQLQDPLQCPGPLLNIQSPPVGLEEVSHGLATYKLNIIHSQHSYTTDKKKEDILKGTGGRTIWKSGEI